jgi:hypothetical protein
MFDDAMINLMGWSFSGPSPHAQCAPVIANFLDGSICGG